MSIIRRLLSSPSGGASVGLLVVGGLAVATVSSSLYNVDGGHAAIVFNRFVGVKETVYGEVTTFCFYFFCFFFFSFLFFLLRSFSCFLLRDLFPSFHLLPLLSSFFSSPLFFIRFFFFLFFFLVRQKREHTSNFLGSSVPKSITCVQSLASFPRLQAPKTCKWSILRSVSCLVRM